MAPRCLFCIIIFLNLSFTSICLEIYDSPNVKTAIFDELDVRRSCWNHDDINLLRARMIMQDLIPKKVPRDMPYLVEYLRGTEEAVVKHSPEGKVRRIMMMALSDVLGGYLQAVAIPMAKEAYYAGNIDYATMSRLYELMNEMKARLRTDGGKWSRPVDMSKFSVKVTKLNLPMDNSELACKAMFVTPRENCPPGSSRISIPYLDYDAKPGAVALPLKSRNLYSLKTAASSHIIVRFYILARQCLSEMPASDTEKFNYHFIQWLVTRVIPHLYEDLWYPGFGSVMRIVETVNETEILISWKPMYGANDSSLEKSLLNSKSCGVVGSFRMMAKYNFWWLVLLLFFLLLFLLFTCGCCYWAYQNYKSGNMLGQKDSGILNAVLSIYCGLKEQEAGRGSRDKPSVDTGYYRGSSAQPPYDGDADTSTIPTTSEDEEDSTTSTT